MSGVFIKDETLKNIADVIRKKTRTNTAMHPSEMPFRIQSYLGQLTFEGGGRFYPDKIEDLSHKYQDSILKMSPVCGQKVVNMYYTYYNCHNLTGSAVCGPNVTVMSFTYGYCYNLTGSPVCGPNVINMVCTYTSCHNLTGSPVCGPNVTNMSFTYDNCHNLTGSPVCGPNVTNMFRTYFNCQNLTGYPVYGNSAIDTNEAYLLTNLDHSYIFYYLNFNKFNSIITYPELGIELNTKLENYFNSINIITTNLYDYYNQQEFTKFTNIFTYAFIYNFFHIAHESGNLGSRHVYENYYDAEKININNFTYFDGNEYVTKNVRYVICVSCNYYGDSRDPYFGNTQINIGFFEPLD